MDNQRAEAHALLLAMLTAGLGVEHHVAGKSLLEGGLRVGYNWNYGNYEVALFGRNITDREVIVSGIDFNNLTGMVNEPRVWGLEFTGRF